MAPSPPPYETVCDFIPLKYEEPKVFVETYGFAGSQGYVHADAVLMRPKDRPSDTLLVFMHPSAAQHILPVPRSLPALGLHVLCAQNRYFRNDSALIFEKAILDLGAHIRHARDVLGYRKIVLVGWSGGGPLITFYQAQAENPTLVDTPAGDPVDIKGAGLSPGDAVIFQAASISRARILAEYIDPSVRDEANPDDRIVDLDIYDPRNPNRPPYSADFIDTYRAAQLARLRKITATVRDTIDTLRRRGTSELERGFVTHRTMADLRWFDLSIDPNDRKPGVSFIGDPASANTGPAGFARFCTLRSWLSQWSIDDSRADAVACARGITVPFLAIENGGDDGAPASHVRAVHAAAASADKTMQRIPGANHYYAGQPELLDQANATVLSWLAERGLWQP
jgi:pimeloyl-ACP methyl ester carboxylesterase